MKLCVFPNDPIRTYFEKGEIKERYYNPGNFFDRVDLITLVDEDIQVSQVQRLVGNAKLRIFSVGKIGIRDRKKHVKAIIELVGTIKPDVIRAYNPLIEGWLAASCAKKLKIPFWVSLHTQFDYNRKIVKKTNLKKYLVLKYTEKFIEPFVLKTADKITAVYKIIVPYVLNHSSKKPEILYNKVDCERFSKSQPIDSLPSPLIISVGSLIQVKNHQCLIKAIKDIDAHLLIVGNGELYGELINLIKKLMLENKITIIKSIPNNQIQNYYKSAQIFALAYNPEIESIPIPVMEAMASGLPVVIPFPKEGFSEGLENIAIFAEQNPESFAKNFQKLLDDSKLREEYAEKAKVKSLDFDNKKIEKRESQIYSELLEDKGDTCDENFSQNTNSSI